VNAAIVGVGYTEFFKKSGRSELDLAREACLVALEDAGLQPAAVDGIASYMLLQDSVPTQAVATVLGIEELRFSLDLNMGGQAPCHLVTQAAAAITTGQASVVLIYRAMNGRSGRRVGRMEFGGGGGQYRYPIRYSTYMMYVAMWASRFLYESGQGEEDLAAVAIAQRTHAQDNMRAMRKEPLTVHDYIASPYVVEPFRVADCASEVDGACAIVLTSLPRARDLRHPPAVIAAGGYRAGYMPGLDIGDHLAWPDYSRNYTTWLARDIYARADISPSDIDFAEIYDCFTSTVLMGLEGLGLCGRGESGAFVRNGGTTINGALPTNTNGGLLSEGYLHGMNTVAEGVLQLQGRRGAHQVARHGCCIVTSGALMDGSALILMAD
jgi:acetyl-CoA acetyltransferase